MNCAICYRKAKGYGWFNPRLKPSDPNRYSNKWVFCSRRCQDAFCLLMTKTEARMIDPSDMELAAMRACLSPLGEYVGSIGMERPLADYTREEVLTLIAQGLQTFEPVKGRSQLRSLTLHGRSLTLVDDSYNANPDSVRAAIDMLAGLPGPRWLVLGDMGEVGTQGPAFHAEVGAYAKERGIEHFWVAGELCVHAAQAYGVAARVFASSAEIVSALSMSPAGAPEVASVLVKGSRFMKMELVVAALQGGAHAA